MKCVRDRHRMRFLCVPLAGLLGVVPISACAEIEVGAEVAKRIGSAALSQTSPITAPSNTTVDAEQIELAQAGSSSSGQSQAISPFLQPAPDIFEATGLAVWDGKRTLQGVWVAHPLATSARRVRIFNQNNGQAVDGALFKRDTADSGASILISSEAAQLLGMDVGTPSELRIVAVSPVQRSTEPEKPAEPLVTNQANTQAANDTVAEVTAPKTEPASKTAELPAPTPTKKPEPNSDARSATAAVPAESDEPEKETQISAITPVKPAKTATAATTSPLKLPFIQAGIFGVEENATKLIRRIKGKDMPAVGRALRSKGKKLTRVLAGPFQTVAERNAALRKIRAMGLKDAAPVRR